MRLIGRMYVALREMSEAFTEWRRAERRGLAWPDVERAKQRTERVHVERVRAVLDECRWQLLGGELKRCPLCQTAALEGEEECSGCGGGPFEDWTWREERSRSRNGDEDTLRVRGAIWRYARHRNGCTADGLSAPSEECSCGLGALLDRIQPERVEEVERGGD